MTSAVFTEQLNQNRLTHAYLRLAEETKKVKESPGARGVAGEPEQKHVKKKKQPKQEIPAEQMRMF